MCAFFLSWQKCMCNNRAFPAYDIVIFKTVGMLIAPSIRICVGQLDEKRVRLICLSSPTIFRKLDMITLYNMPRLPVCHLQQLKCSTYISQKQSLLLCLPYWPWYAHTYLNIAVNITALQMPYGTESEVTFPFIPCYVHYIKSVSEESCTVWVKSHSTSKLI
jgi:hypothetical protein